MKKKNGFTLVELIVSFSLITVISLSFFKTVLTLQEQQLKNIARNNLKSFTIALNSLIQKDFTNDKIESIIACGNTCYDITYKGKGLMRLSYDQELNAIVYGDKKEKIPKDYKLISKIEAINDTSDVEGINSYITLNISLKSNFDSKIESIKYMYQYDKEESDIEIDLVWNGAKHIKNLFDDEVNLKNGLTQIYAKINEKKVNAGIRYVGSKNNVKNKIYFNCEDVYAGISYGKTGYDYGEACELWRIIGIFDVEDGNETTEERIKIVRDEPFKYSNGNIVRMSWDSSVSDVNSGSGINQWGESTYTNGTTYEGADLMRLLNGYYIGEEDECSYCNAAGQANCTNNCTSSVKKINNIFVNMIDSINWNTNLIEYVDVVTPSDAYEQEMNEQGKNINSILHTATWSGKVGLINVSDYGYAASNCSDLTEETCGINNWINDLIDYDDSFWTINSASNTDMASSTVWFVNGGRIRYSVSSSYRMVLPSLYLKSKVQIIGGNGDDEPYILSM